MERGLEKRDDKYELHRIGVLDGIRASAVLLVVWYHFWQQSWIIPVTGALNLDWLVRNGAIAVDMMVLLSGFCLFLPYARNMVYGEKQPSAKDFYIKRAARILPSYYVSLFLILFCFALPLGEYSDLTQMLRDLVPHLLFIHNWFSFSALSTHLNGVLWTVAVLVQFYLIFPLLAKAFQKKPFATYGCMTAVGLISSFVISSRFESINQMLFVNHTLTFFCVYANGMLGAWFYVAWTKEHRRTKPEGLFFTVAALACLWLFKVMCGHRMNYSSDTKWQVDYRFLLSFLFLLFIISTILSLSWFRFLWDNRFMRFFAQISFNLYICHQYIAVKLKELRIPYWEGEIPPNQLGDEVWKWKYLLLCIVLSLLVAAAMTYLVEKPVAKWIRRQSVKA